ncbi:MAG TPA: glutamyl-tRNA reductase [Myxococcales bacterium]|jgi:glutamyl-tRNA reductase
MAEIPQRDFCLVGLSHKTAPVEVREKLAFGPQLPQVLGELRALDGVEELLLVSTCNRVEAYLFGAADSGERVRTWLVGRAGEAVGKVLYQRRGGEAIKHLFRVSSSLDSMVLGEPQILGQVKDAFAAAQDAGTLGGAVGGAAQAAFATAKRVRTETAIGSAPVSMASAAVELAKKIFGTLEGRAILLVGAGKMSELTAKHLAGNGTRVLVTNRTFSRGEELAAKVGGKALPWDQLPQLLTEADIVVSSTAAPRPVLTVPMLQTAIKARKWRPLFLVDLAVPRDIEEGAGKIENVYAYDVDDLQSVVQEGKSSREEEAKKAEQIVAQEVQRFLKGRQVRDQLPVLAALRLRADEIARAEAERTMANCGDELSPKQRKSIEAMGKAIVNKLLHGATVQLRDAGQRSPEEAAALAQVVAQLFDLDPHAAPPARPSKPTLVADAEDPAADRGRAENA